jgi:hypothetical protein
MNFQVLFRFIFRFKWLIFRQSGDFFRFARVEIFDRINMIRRIGERVGRLCCRGVAQRVGRVGQWVSNGWPTGVQRVGNGCKWLVVWRGSGAAGFFLVWFWFCFLLFGDFWRGRRLGVGWMRRSKSESGVDSPQSI